MAAVITTLGTRAAENVNISSVVGAGPWTVTLSGAPTSDTVIGDTLTDEAASPKAFLITGISGADLTVRDAFGAGATPDASGASQATTIRTYSTLGALSTGSASANLLSSGDTLTAYICETITQASAETLFNGIVAGVTSVTLSGHASYRHSGTFGSGAGITITYAGDVAIQIASSIATFIVEWLEFYANISTGDNWAHGIGFYGTTAQYTLRNCLLRHNLYAAAVGVPSAVYIGETGVKLFAYNNIIKNFENPTNGTGYGFNMRYADWTGVGAWLYNNTVYNCGTAGYSWSYLGRAKNCIGMDNGLDFEGSWHGAECSYNYTKDGTAPGTTGSQTGQNTTDTFSDTTDLHLKATANAVGAGTDLTGVLSGIATDIDGETRSGSWDVGADQYSAVAGSPSSSLSASGSASSSAPPTTIAPIIQNLFLRD